MRFLSAGHPDRAAVRRNPYPFYDRLRSHAPVMKTELGPWLVTSYEAVNRLVRTNRWTRESGVREQDLSLAERVFLRSLVFRDPPAHTRLRRILSPLFTPSAIEKRRQRTRAIAKELLDGLREREEFEFRSEFASELPVRLICEFIGMPLDARVQFETWAHTVRDLQELTYNTEDTDPAARRSSIAVPARTAVLERANRIAAECLAYFETLLEQKRKAPGQDITSMLLASSASDDAPLTSEEIVATLIILHVGGHSTTTDAIATGQYNLFRQPEAQAALRLDPTLVESAVEEMLRFDPPVTTGIPRIAPEDVELGGITIPRGDHVYPVLAAANRDPGRFPDPHRFDIRRGDNDHVAFSKGIHFCLGAPLGRQEAQVAFALLATDYPPLAPAVSLDELEWQDSLPHRGLIALPVRWGAP